MSNNITITTVNQTNQNTEAKKTKQKSKIKIYKTIQKDKLTNTYSKNITQRKKQRPSKQNAKNAEEYWIDNLPHEITKKNYPPLNNENIKQNTNQTNKEQQPETTRRDEAPANQLSQDINIIKAAPIFQQPNQENEVEFLSPPVVSK